MEAKCLVLLALVATTVAGPITIQDTDSCSTTCKPSKKFNFAPQTTYVYDYRVDTTTSMAGASEDSARMTLQTRVNIEVVSSCEFALTLDNTRLFNSDVSGALQPADRSAEFSRALEANTLRFSYQDGVVESVCIGNNEPAWVLNIKKGILSSFQNSMDDLTKSQNTTETDVSGSCETEYEAVSNGYYSTTVKKVKNMLSCTDRNSYDSIWQMVQYRVPSEIQSAPIMKTTHKCSQEIQNGGVLKTSTCVETHTYRPFANNGNGGSTTITQTLEYSTSRRGVSSRRMSMSSRDSLIFDHSASQLNAGQARRTVEQRLQDICQSTQNDIRPESPRLFSELVQAMRSLSDRDTESLHKLLKSNTICPTNNKAFKFFLDALPVTGTSASVKLMTSLLTSGEVTGLQAKAWLTSLAFIRAPVSEMLVDAKTLIDNEALSRDAILPVSSLVNNFCRRTRSCENDYAVLSVMASLERNIGYSCDASGKSFERVLLSLRGIGNAGHATRSVKMINRCLTNQANPIEIRVAAAEAFRRMPCDAEDNELWKVLEDEDLDSELRIAAYLALVRCPSDSTLNKFAELLASEKNEQVGAFIYSHLTNLKQTSDPHKQEIAKAVAKLDLDKEFDLNPLKYSRNYEASALINKINTGVVADSNLVWSSETQMPRSLSGNLTVELFGQSINMIDFGGRLEGLEYLIKKLFGPYLEDKAKSRGKAEDVEGSIYGRIFGNEMLFLHSKLAESPFKGLPSNWLEMIIALSKQHDYALTQSDQFMDVNIVIPTTSGLPINVHVNGTSTLDLVLNGKMDLRKIGSKPRSLDIDGEIKPSAAVEVTGTMSVDAFVTKAGLRMRNILHSSTSIKGRVQLDRGQLLNVELDTPQDRMDVFSASSQFYIVHNEIEKEQDMITENRKQFKVCSGDKLATITGMELCGEVSFPNASMKVDSPYYPLTGPSRASLTLYKKDSHSGYKFFAKRAENQEASFAQISFNTPGSRVNRAMLAEINLNYPKQELSATIVSPWKQAKFTGAVMNNDELKSISGSLEIDEKDTYGLTTEVKVTETKARTQLNPMFELRRPGSDNIQVTGFVTLINPFKALDLDLSLSGVSALPYNVKGSIANNKKEKSISASFSSDGKTEYSVLASNKINIMGSKSVIANLKSLFKVHTPERQLVAMAGSADYREGKSFKMDGSMDVHRLLKKPATFKVSLLKSDKKKATRYDLDANVKSSSLTSSIDSYLVQKPSGFIATKASVDYTIPKVAKNKVIVSGKWNVKSASSYKRYTLKSNLNVKRNPEYNLALAMNLDHKKKNSGGSLELKYGANPKDKSKRILLSSSLTSKLATWKQALVDFKANALAPEHNIDISLVGKHQHNKKVLDSSLGLNYGGKGKDVTASVTIRNKSAKLMKVNGNMNLAWPGSEYTLKTDLTQNSPKEYEHVVNLKDSSGQRHIITTTYKTPKNDAHAFSSNIRLDGMRPMTVSGSVTLDPMNFETSGQVEMGKQTYGLSTTTKLTKAPRAYASVEFVYPARKVVLVVDGGKSKGKYDGNVEASWDADSDKSKKITIGGTYNYDNDKDNANIGGSLAFTSPFKNFENLFSNIAYSSDDSKHGINGKVSWGRNNDMILSSVDIMKPVSFNNIKLNAEAKTPFEGFKKATLDITHSLDDKLNTLIKGSLEKESAKLAINGEAKDDIVSANVALRTSANRLKSVALDFYHKCRDGRTASKSTLALNKDTYGYDLNMDHSMNGWSISNNGDLTVLVPGKRVVSNWQHKNSDSDMKSTWTSEWGGKKLRVIASGSHDFYNGNGMSASLAVDSPWTNVEAAVNHRMSTGFINSNAFYKQGRDTKASAALRYTRKNNVADAKFEITSPFHADINGKIKADYDRFPMTGSAELQWAPRSKIDIEGSVDANNWDKSEAQLKVTTPFDSFRNVILKGSNTMNNGVMVSHLNLDYGVKQNIDLESRFACNDYSKLLRFKLMTPFSALQSLNTGLKFNGQRTNFDGVADFELLPSLGKFQASMNMDYDDRLKGTLRIETPFADYPYFELTTTSQKKDNARNSFITAEYYPRQMFRLDTTYAFTIPLTFEATINSPYYQYNDLSISIKHDHSPSSVLCHGEVTYQPNKKIEADVSADWSNAMEGSIVVKTPFTDFESSKIYARHHGNEDAFSSHAEMNVAGKSVIADANYNGGYSSKAIFTFTSPIPGLESIELSMNKKGNNNNIKGDATFILNGDKTEATLIHKLRSDSLQSSFSLNSPYTEEFKTSIEHNGRITNFNNKMYVSYGRDYDVDTIVTFDYRNPDVTGNVMLKYKLGGDRDIARVSFTKAGYVDDMTFSGTAGMNRDDISVNGSWKSVAGYNGAIQIKTPFDGYGNVGFSMNHVDQTDGFKSNFDLNYMDNQHITGKMSADIPGPEKIRLSTELHTPFQNFESTVITLSNNYDSYRMSMNGQADLTTTIGRFGSAQVVYNKAGGLDNFAFDITADMNGKQLTTLKLTNNMPANEIHSQLSFNTAATSPLVMKLDHLGDLNNFRSQASAKYGRNMVSGEASLKQGSVDIDAEAMMNYYISGIGSNSGSVKLHKDGNLNSFNTRASGKLGNDEAVVSVSKSGPIDDMNFRSLMSYNRDSISVEGAWKNQGSIEGSVQVKTPFDDFRNLGMKLIHTGELTDFSSSLSVDYMDNNNINGKIELSVDSINRLRFNTELNTPFRNYEKTSLRINNDFDQYAMTLSGNAYLTTSMPGMNSASIQYSKTGPLNNLVIEGKAIADREQIVGVKLTNKRQDNDLNTAITIDSAWNSKVMLTLDHTGTLYNFYTNGRAILGRNNVLSTEVSLKTYGNTVDATGKAAYSLQKYGANEASIAIHKEGELDDFSAKATGKYGNNEMTVTGSLKLKDELSGSVNVDTGMRGHKNIGMSFRHSGGLERFNTEAQINYVDGQYYSTKIDFYRYLYRRIETTVELKTPIAGYEYTKYEYRHEGETDSFKCYSTLEYSNSQKITYELSAVTAPKPDFSIKIKTPFDKYEDLMVSASYDYNWPTASADGKINTGNGNVINLNANFDASNDITGSVVLSTPFEDFTDIGLSFEHSSTADKFESKGRITYMDGKEISGKTTFKLPLKRMYVSAELKTPFNGYEFTKYEQKINNNKREYTESTSLVYGNGKLISQELTLTYTPTPGFSFIVKTPYQPYEELMATGSFDMSGPKYELKSKLSAGPGKVITLNGALDSSNDVTGYLTLNTPVDGFTDIGASFQHSGSDQKFNCEGKVTYKDGKDISGKVSFFRYGWRRIVASAELSTPFSGMEQTKADVSYEDNSNSISATAALDYNNGEKMNGNIKFTFSPNYDMLVTVNTPFYDYRMVRAQASLDMTAPSYSVTSSLNYGNNNAFSANGKINLYSARNADGSVELTTPFDGMKYTKVDYKYKVEYPRADGSISLTYDSGKIISGDLKSTVSPTFDSSVVIKTPFYGYETLKGAASFDSSSKKYDASSSLTLGRGQVYSMTSGLDYSIEPMKVYTKISTPFDDFRNVELTASHEGTLNNFKSSAFFSSPITRNVNAKAEVRYESVYDMSVTTSLKSALPEMDALLMEVKRSDMGGEKKSQLVLGWTDGKQITADTVYSRQQGWYETKVHTDLAMTTPFEGMRSMNLQIDHNGKENSGGQKVQFDFNGNTYLDVDTEYSSKDKFEGSVTFSKPWAMQYTATAFQNGGVSDANIYANWNRDEVNSNVRLISSYTDKSDDYNMNRELDISMECASRKMGVYYQMNGAGYSINSNGKIYWDDEDDSKVTYGLTLKDNSRRSKSELDGSIRLGLPTRTLELAGSYSDNNVAKAMDGTFSWDADRDDSKQFGVKTSMIRGDPIKGEIALIMPAIRKEIRVNGEIMMKSGKVIFDGKTDISYSTDSRKTLTLISRLEDISDYSNNYNYSLALGVKHPYTNVDISLNSHLGSSDEKYTLGMNAAYLTAKRQEKNMALLAEINSLRSKMSVQIFNPMHDIEVTGDVLSTSPYKVLLVNRMDGEEAFRSDVTVDCNEKSLLLNTYMGNNAIAVSAGYPNTSAFRAVVTHVVDGYSHQEALLALRLNTSRLLHTRLAWNTDLYSELRQAVLERVARSGERISADFNVINDAVAEELSAKYKVIAESTVNELRPLINILEREMSAVSIKMRELSAALREMYEKNDFYIQDMGVEVTEAYMALQDRLATLNREYITMYRSMIDELTNGMRQMTTYPLGQRYTEMVKETTAWVEKSMSEALEGLSTYLTRVDAALKEYKESMKGMTESAVDSLYNNTYVNYMSNQISTIGPYVKSFEMPKQYTEAIYNVHNAVNSRLNSLMQVPEIAYIQGGVNEVYQQGVWAYNYWQIEENINRHMQSILKTLKEIIADELRENFEINPVTVWLPGEVQAEFPLPVEVRRLDSLDELEMLYERAENWLQKNKPDTQALETLAEKLSSYWPSSNPEVSELEQELKDFKPRKKLRELKTGKRYRARARAYAQ